jgi:hypothetical protein
MIGHPTGQWGSQDCDKGQACQQSPGLFGCPPRIKVEPVGHEEQEESTNYISTQQEQKTRRN